MKYFLWVFLFSSHFILAQSADGNGKTDIIPIVEINQSPFAQTKRVRNFIQEGKAKFKKGQPVKFIQWFNYRENDTTFRYRREYDEDHYLYDEHFVARRNAARYQSVSHYGKHIAYEYLTQRGYYFAYDRQAKVYDEGVLQATLFFGDDQSGRPTKIYINHYYANGQLQFTREIESPGEGEPFVNVGVVEAYYPDGTRFENPLNEDGTAIIILDDNGEAIDQCDCMGDDIMTWGAGYLYSFLGKYYYLLQHVYEKDGLECCWE